MSVKNKAILLLAFLLSVSFLLFFLKQYQNKAARKYLIGEYHYLIPTGEIQQLIIDSNYIFRQTIYSKGKKEILFENSGKMHVDGKELEFDHWLECYELAEQKILRKPYITNSTGSYWRKPTKNRNTWIIIFDETHYIFRKQ